MAYFPFAQPEEGSNDDEFKAELNQYLKKRPLDSSDDVGRKEDTCKKNPNKRSGTPSNASMSVTPSVIQNRTSSNSLPSTPALVEAQTPTPNPTPTPNSKPFKVTTSHQQVNKIQSGSSSSSSSSSSSGSGNGGGGGGGSGGASSPSVVKKARSKLAEGGCEAAFDELLAGKERRLEEELNMLSKVSEKTRGLASAHNLKREKLSPSGQYNQLLSQQMVNNAAIVKNGLVNNESCLKERCVIASFF